jgi:hypothetical protein
MCKENNNFNKTPLLFVLQLLVGGGGGAPVEICIEASESTLENLT